MQLISIIPGFQPMTDRRLLDKAAALTPALVYTEHPMPVRCALNGEEMTFEALASRPLSRGDQAVLDFGHHLVGRVALGLDCAGSHQDAPAFFRLDMAEIAGELDEDAEVYDGWLSRSWIQQEKLHVDLLPARISLPRRYAFRYLRLTVLDTSPKYQLLLKEASCVSESSADPAALPERHFADSRLNSIYEASLRTLKDCSQQVLEDGPKRDRRLWLGDLRLQALTSYVSYRSYDLIKRCLYLFAGSRFPDGRMSANVFTDAEPEADDTYLMDYALMFPLALNEYLEETGDREALNDLLEPALEQVEYVLRHGMTAEGTVTPEQSASGFIDWSDGLDRQASLQGVLICALDAASFLCARAGDEQRRCRYAELAQSMRDAARTEFWSDERGLCVSGGQVSVHSQVWMTLADVMTGETAARAMDAALAAPDAPPMGSPYMHHYYVMALLRAGCREQALDHLRSYWGGMLDAGGDTFWECWVPDEPRTSPYGGMIVNSFCHAWSCTPAYLLTKFFLTT